MSKKQWKNIDLSLQFAVKSDWSQEEIDTPLSDVNTIRSSLPTKTNASRQTAELDNIPENGPFILNFANMPFEASEAELKQFFRAFQIYHIELNNPRRGCGHIEFTNLADLAGAWKLNEKTFLNRPLRLSIPLKEDMARQQAMSNKPKYQSQQKPSTLNSDDSDNWRSRKPQPVSQKEPLSANKPDENSNWRGRGTRVETTITTETTAVVSDQSAWRNRAPRDSATKPDTEASAWRTQTPRETIAKVTDSNAGEKSAWRNRGPRETDSPKTIDIDDVSNWRQKGNVSTPKKEVIADNNKADSDSGGDNWRRSGRGAEVRAPVASDSGQRDHPVKVSSDEQTGPSTVEPVESASLDGKKRSIFGDARPVDTATKDLEVEAKLEQTKLVVDSPKQDTQSNKPSAWKKTANQPTNVTNVSGAPDKSSTGTLEWREKKQVVATPSNIKAEPTVESLPKKIELPVAPPPTINVWKERMKSKSSCGSELKKDVGSSKEEIVAVKKEEIVSVKKEEMVSPSYNIIVPTKKEDEHVPGKIEIVVKEKIYTEEQESKIGSVYKAKTAVISVNGPYIDIKSHKAPPVQHSIVPESVPAKMSGSSGSQSSWAQGPPKGLRESNYAGDRQ